MLSPHNLLVAAIFFVYVGSMGGLIAYACSTGTYRSEDQDEPPDTGEDEAGADLRELRAAA
jgi:hypothetical protein